MRRNVLRKYSEAAFGDVKLGIFIRGPCAAESLVEGGIFGKP